MRNCAQSRVVAEKQVKSQSLVPGTSPYSDDRDVHMDTGNAEFGEADQGSAAVLQRCVIISNFLFGWRDTFSMFVIALNES